MKIDLRTIVLLGAVAVLCFLLMDTCSFNIRLKNQAVEYANYKDTVMTYKARNGDIVAYNESLELDQGLMLKMNDSLSDALKNIKIKDPVTYTKIITVMEIDTIEVRFTDTLPCAAFVRTFQIDSIHYQLGGRLTRFVNGCIGRYQESDLPLVVEGRSLLASLRNRLQPMLP